MAKKIESKILLRADYREEVSSKHLFQMSKSPLSTEQVVDTICEMQLSAPYASCAEAQAASALLDEVEFEIVIPFPSPLDAISKLLTTPVNLTNFDNKAQHVLSSQVRINRQNTVQNVFKCPFLIKQICFSMETTPYIGSITGHTIPSSLAAEGVVPVLTPTMNQVSGIIDRSAVLSVGQHANQLADYFVKYTRFRIEAGCDAVILEQPLSVLGVQCSGQLKFDGNNVNEMVTSELQYNERAKQLNPNAPLFVADAGVSDCSGNVSLLPVCPTAGWLYGGNCYNLGLGGCYTLQYPLCAMKQMSVDIWWEWIDGFENELAEAIQIASEADCVSPIGGASDRLVQYFVTVVLTNPTPAPITGSYVTTGGVIVPFSVAAGGTFQLPPGTYSYTVNPDTLAATAAPLSGDLHLAGITVAAGVNITAASVLGSGLTVTVVGSKADMGSACVKVCKFGELKLKVTLFGAYLSPSQAMYYFRRYAAPNPKLRELYMGTQAAATILNTIAMDHGFKAGLAGLPELQDAQNAPASR
jgi:hypothetical protein